MITTTNNVLVLVLLLGGAFGANGFSPIRRSFTSLGNSGQQYFRIGSHQHYSPRRAKVVPLKNHAKNNNDDDLPSSTSTFITQEQQEEDQEVSLNTATDSNTSTNNCVDETNSKDIDTTKNGGIFERVSTSISTKVQTWQQVSKEGFGTKAKNVASTMVPGDIVVPLCANLQQRQELANRGIYAGVEYLVCSIVVLEEDSDKEEEEERVVMIQPRYPLRDHLERDDWPVQTQPCVDAPIWISRATWEAGTALGTLGLTGGYLIVAAILAIVVRFVYVPSESMIPNLNPGDIVLVTRSLPIVQKAQAGDVVLFDPPTKLIQLVETIKERQTEAVEQESTDGTTTTTTTTIVAANDRNSIQSLSSGTQLLKRVVAVPNERVGVKNSNPYVETGQVVNVAVKEDESQDPQQQQQQQQQQGVVPKRIVRADIVGPYARAELLDNDSYWNRSPQQLGPYEYFVAGDNGYRSVDSRVWGPLEQKYIYGTAKWVLYPPQHFGPIPSSNNMVTIELPITTTSSSSSSAISTESH